MWWVWLILGLIFWLASGFVFCSLYHLAKVRYIKNQEELDAE